MESGQADGIEGFVIGAAGVAHRERGDAEIFQRLDPLHKNRGDGRVTLQIDSADSPAAIVEVEIRGQLLMLGL